MTARALLAGALLPASLIAQTPATSYEQRYAEVMALAPRGDRVASVSNLVLQRDVAKFSLRSGTLALLTSVGGRTVGAVFRGEGAFSFSPPTEIERARLQRFEKTTELVATFSELVLLFTDTTEAQLEHALQFGQGQVPSAMSSLVKQSLDYLADQDSKSFQPDLMAAFLNSESTGVFYAHVVRDDGGPVMFMLDPSNVEAVSLAHRAPRIAWAREPEVICQFAQQGAPSPQGVAGAPPVLGAYRLDVTMTQTGSGDLSFAAGARIEVAASSPVGPWVPLELFEKLKIDSARWEGGEVATVFRGKDAPVLWLNLGRQLHAGDIRPLLLYYHGDLIDRFGDFFYVKSPSTWYPISLDWLSHATFDLTFHTPSQYSIASIGDRTDSSVANRVLTTRWVMSEPTRNASFNLGLFEPRTIQQPGLQPVTVLVSEQAHRRLEKELREQGVMLLEQRDMKGAVATDVVQSLQFFQRMFGPVPTKHFYATEVPLFLGMAFPGMIDLSWLTFQQTTQAGEDQVFRAHEVAHQWWGVGVDFASYHDQWLSEGFADFSGLWFLQTSSKEKDKYFGILHNWRANILLHRNEPSPIWLGYRAASSKDETGYNVLIYQKGAWVLHMLRVLMLDLPTANEDRFTQMMAEFYRTYRGQHASTADFQRVVEQYAGISMDWFFNEWVYGTGIPSYRVAYRTEPAEGGKYRVRLRVTQDNVPDDFQMYVPVTVDFGGGREARLRVKVAGPSSEITLPLMPLEPKGLTFNALDGVLAEVKMVGW
jgi:hypothetical protein